MNIPGDLKYTEGHEWIRVEGNVGYIGITDHAQHELGDIVYVEFPEIGNEIKTGESFGSIEAVKTVEDLNSPISGEVVELNEKLEDEPDLINKSAFEDGWIIKIKMSDKKELQQLLDAKEYAKIIEQ